jgi:hypothetical protein
MRNQSYKIIPILSNSSNFALFEYFSVPGDANREFAACG